MASPDSSIKSTNCPSRFVRVMRKIYRPLGFQKGYNFPLFVIFGGAMLGFFFARVSYMNVAGDAKSSFKNSSAPGEWYHYHAGYRRIGITLHLATCLPCGFLMVWQFVPVIRHKFLIFHRINGYLVILLAFLSNAGAMMISRQAFGGGLDVQTGMYFLAFITTVSICMAYYNVKRLQIDQHRAWMLRAMFYMGTIITLRIIFNIAGHIITKVNSYDQIQSCEEVAFLAPPLARKYPQCRNATGNPKILVHANYEGKGGPEHIGAAIGLSFGMATWLAIAIHAIGVEIYLNLTPAESQRLRTVSYERQLEAGFKNPGSAGLTSDRWGDAPIWKPLWSRLRSSSEQT